MSANPTATVPPARPGVPGTGELPDTGWAGVPIALTVASLVIGVALVLLARYRRRTDS